MKKAVFILFMAVLLFTACKKQNPNLFQLEGEVAGLQQDTLYIIGIDERFERMDTIFSNEDGTFDYETEIDTITPFCLVFPNNRLVFFFGERTATTYIKGGMAFADSITVTGGQTNEELNLFYSKLDSLEKFDSNYIELNSLQQLNAIQARVDSFVVAHPYSEACINLIRDYYVNIDNPNIQKITEIIKKLSGTLQDNSYLKEVIKKVTNKQLNTINSSFPLFELYDSKGDTLRPKDFQDKFLLITFWASWNAQSIEALKVIGKLQEKFKKEDFEVINISLDVNKQKWLNAIQSDTLTGYQVCEGKAWNSSFIERYNIREIPATILLNKQKRIVAFDLLGEELDKRLESLFKQDRDRKKNSNITQRRL